MKIQAIMMMKNDIKRMEFVLENFFKHNPDIPVLVYNCGGKSPIEEIKKFSNARLIDYDDIWHKKTHCGVGSFDPRWFKLMFDYGLNKDYTHTLFLETDVFTTKKISIEPKHDMSGILNYCGGNEIELYKYLNLDLAPHSSCGSTIFRREFFEKANANLHLVEKWFQDRPQNFFADLIMTLLGRISGCTYGYWEECSDLRGYHVPTDEGRYRHIPSSDYSTTFVHSLKI
jgi:hypothetical protein